MKHIIDIKSLSIDQIKNILFYAKDYKKNSIKEKILIDKIVVLIFFENSTRTLLSFDIAAKRLGANTTILNIETSSMKKEEDLLDTIYNINSMQPDFMIIRNGNNGTIKSIIDNINCSIINAGEGINSHPTQAIIDLFTIIESEMFSYEKLEKINIAICGDILHSRVAYSNIELMKKFNIIPILIAPDYFLPENNNLYINGKIYRSLKEAFSNEDIDYLMMLRVQKERLNRNSSFYNNVENYIENFGLNKKNITKKVKILHPGPVNKGIEISCDIPKNNNLILTQVMNSIYVRQSILKYLISD